jgi:hypothetical protein
VRRSPSGYCGPLDSRIEVASRAGEQHDGTIVGCKAARSLGVAWFAGAAALSQMWLFIVAPITGAVIAGASYARITGAPSAAVGIAENPELDTHEQTAERSG